MAFKEVQNLRKNGNLHAAYEMATNDLQVEPESIWAKRAVAWCIYDFLKENAIAEKNELFVNRLLELKNLNMPEEEKMIFDASIWPIFSIVKDCINKKWISNDFLYKIFNIFKLFSFSKPSKEYSILLKAFLPLKESWIGFIEFCDWWNLDNLSENDYSNEVLPNGKKIISLAERVYIAYSKVLLLGLKDDGSTQNQVELFISKLSIITEKHPEYLYLLYFKAKLLLAIGQNENVVNLLRPFVLQKQNDFWLWEIIGDAMINDEDMKFSCYCKALTCQSKEEMLVGLREKFTFMLLKQKLFNEAKTEIIKIIKVREQNHWQIKAIINDWQTQDWFISAKEKEDNNQLYKDNLSKAELLLYNDIQEQPIIISFINERKGMVSFITKDKQQGFTSCKDKRLFNKYPTINDVYLCRMVKLEIDKPTKIITTKKIDNKDLYDGIFFKSFTGKLSLNKTGSFGLIKDDENIFVSSDLLTGKENFSIVSGKAVINFDKKFNKWGWKAIQID